MGFPTVWHSHTTALRMNLGVQSQGPTSQGATTRVSREAAVSSTKKWMWSWRCRSEAGQEASMGPSAMAFTASALSSPQAIRTMRPAVSIVPMPIVMALCGVEAMSWLKFLAWRLRDL